MEGPYKAIEGEQKRSDKNSVNILEELSIPELDEIIEQHINWDDIDPIIEQYYPKFASIRQVSKLIDFIEEHFGVRPSKNTVGKRYERMSEARG